MTSEELREFIALRYSLVEDSHHSLDVHPLPTPKGRAVLIAIEQDWDYKLNGVTYGFVGFRPARELRGAAGSTRWYVGKLAKLRQAHMGKKIPGDIIERNEDDWVPVLAVFDLESQHIFVRRDWRFGTPEQTARAIQAGLTEKVLAHYNHRVYVKGRTREAVFWEIVNNRQRVYSLELKLVSPNILDTNRTARDALEALSDLFDQDEIAIKLKNEAGSLEIPREPIRDYVDYIAQGEGSWKLTTEGDRGGKKTHSSSENFETFDLPVPVDETPSETQLELGRRGEFPISPHSDTRLIAEVYAAIKKMDKD